MVRTIVGIFEDAASAQKVLQELKELGIQSNHARLLNNREASASGYDVSGGSTKSSASSSAYPTASSEAHVDSSDADTVGGAGAAEVPWAEKVKSWFGSMFDDDDASHADHYAEAWRRGHHLVVVDTDSESVDEIVSMMNRNGAIDIQRRAEQWRQSGYTGTYDASAAPYTSEQSELERASYSDRAAGAGTNEAIPVVQEELFVGKRVVQRGGVRIHSYVEERPVEEVVRLRDERVNVERRPVSRAADATDMAFKERTVEVTASGEEAVIEKRARVVEEVVVNKEVSERDQKVEETLRRRDVQVESIPGEVARH